MKRDSDLLLATILYADIFDWPLSQKDIAQWGIGGVSPRAVKPHDLPLEDWEGFLFLAGRKQLVGKRKKREVWAARKWTIARRTAAILSLIPTVKLVGVTGGLSRNNVSEHDDIDLFCIVRRGTLWISRLLSILLVELLGRRRRPAERDVTDKVCLNMFMSDDALSLDRNDCDLFAAHEVLQMEPLWERNGTYQKFLQANKWVKSFLPHAWKRRVNGQRRIVNRKSTSFWSTVFSIPLAALEPLAKIIQLWYMKKHRTTEVISEGVLRFHPHDARVWIKRAYEKRLSRYNLPLDKFFYGR